MTRRMTIPKAQSEPGAKRNSRPGTRSLNTERDRRPARLKAGTIGLIEQADVNRKRAFELRLPPLRLSYPAIARKLGVSVSTAYDYVNKEHSSLLHQIDE